MCVGDGIHGISKLDISMLFSVIQQTTSNIFCIFRRTPFIRITEYSIWLNISAMSNIITIN